MASRVGEKGPLISSTRVRSKDVAVLDKYTQGVDQPRRGYSPFACIWQPSCDYRSGRFGSKCFVLRAFARHYRFDVLRNQASHNAFPSVRCHMPLSFEKNTSVKKLNCSCNSATMAQGPELGSACKNLTTPASDTLWKPFRPPPCVSRNPPAGEANSAWNRFFLTSKHGIKNNS